MELNEAARRIFLQHWKLIALVLATCIGGAALLHRGDATTYTASTRLVLDTQDPQSSTGSTVIGDTARAIATSPYEIKQALDQAGIRGRSPEEVAKHVSASALGTSGVLQLSVGDSSPVVAQRLADALAESVIQTRSSVNGKRFREISSNLDARIAQLNRQIANRDARIDVVNRQLAAGATGAQAARLRSLVDAISRTRDFAAQERGVLVSERLGLLSTEALRPQASIISSANRPVKPDPSRAVPDLMLGVLLGLVLGVGIAAVLETLHPRLRGGDALARELRTSHLGSLTPGAGTDGVSWGGEPLSLMLRLAAKGAGVRRVSLLAAEPIPELDIIAKQLETAANHPVDAGSPVEDPAAAASPGGNVAPSSVEAMARRAVGAAPMHVRPFGIDFAMSSNGAATGVVVLAPTSLRRARIVGLNHLLSITPAPVLGLITYSPRRRWPWQSRLSGGDAWTAQPS
jgi:capsular polysaccharide biosynthesis protein